MRLLFVLPQIPWPPESGGRIVTSNTIRRFARSHDVYVVCLYHHRDELRHIETVKTWCREVAAFPAHAKWDVPVLLRSCVSRRPYKALRFLNSDMQGYVSRLVRRERIEVIHAQNFYTTAYVRGDEPCLRIHYKENIEGLLLRRYAETSGNPPVARLARFESERTLKYERSEAGKLHRLLSISPVDTALLKEMEPDLPIGYQRAGVDLEKYLFQPESSGPPTVLFTGTMSYHPNYNGILKFLDEGWSIVRSKIPDATLLIVGHSPPRRLRVWDGRDGVSVTGSVPDIGKFFSRAHVYLVPLWVGGGIRLKILEAMASGRAVASTPIGCEGLEAENNIHLLTAQEPADLAECVLKLLEDKELREKLAIQARNLMEKKYDWDKVIAEQEQNYQQWQQQMRIADCGIKSNSPKPQASSPKPKTSAYCRPPTAY
ncbi:MAG: glycosyltransferase family 4 protein [bacterium]